MTRGKIMFIDGAGRYYQTLEFNGDMYPEGHTKPEWIRITM